jgi:hypothetical protein
MTEYGTELLRRQLNGTFNFRDDDSRFISERSDEVELRAEVPGSVDKLHTYENVVVWSAGSIHLTPQACLKVSLTESSLPFPTPVRSCQEPD